MVVFLIGLAVLASWIIFSKKPKNKDMVYTDYKPQDIDLNAIQWQFYKLLKEHRRSLGLSEVAPEKMCTVLALNRIKDMAHLTKDEFKEAGHKGFFTDAYQGELLKNNFKLPGEILGRHYNSVTGMFRNYLESEEHKDYIENRNIRYVGVGVIAYDYKFYSCIIFAS